MTCWRVSGLPQSAYQRRLFRHHALSVMKCKYIVGLRIRSLTSAVVNAESFNIVHFQPSHHSNQCIREMRVDHPPFSPSIHPMRWVKYGIQEQISVSYVISAAIFRDSTVKNKESEYTPSGNLLPFALPELDSRLPPHRVLALIEAITLVLTFMEFMNTQPLAWIVSLLVGLLFHCTSVILPSKLLYIHVSCALTTALN